MSPTAAGRTVERCRALAQISDERGRLTRPFGTPAFVRASARVAGWMREAGLATRTDAAGNLVGHRPGSDPGAGTLLLGSHLDTVRDAGAFDGPLGVLAALEVVERLPPLPFAIDVIAFADEEGLRFGGAYLGSRAVAGALAPEQLALRDAGGTTVAAALRAAGGDPDAIASASRRGERLLGYCELHIEQGPVLEARGAPVGVVSAITGATRAHVRFDGRAGHAGTVPMALRRDALCAAAEWALQVEATGLAHAGLVATVGRLEAEPAASNVVPGAASATLDVRHADDVARHAAVARLREAADRIAAERELTVTWTPRLDTPATACDPALTGRLAGAVRACGVEPIELVSGAGHDAVALAGAMPVAMLFVRCAGGISHHPDESVAVADVAVAIDVLRDFVASLA